jgi:CBS domain-containing protein
MIVEQILNDKGHEVVTLRAEHTLKQAAELLDAKKIGAVVALGVDDRIIGVLSERDIVRQVARLGAAALDMPVGSAMTRVVISVYPATPIDELVKWKIAETEAEANAMKSYLSAQF